MANETSTRTIECADCGAGYQTRRHNTKYCAVCRLLRDVMYIGIRKTKCLICDQKFCRLDTHDLMCASCDQIPSALHGTGDCALCGEAQTTLVRQGVAVCVRCAKAPEQRKVFIKALARKVQATRATA